MPEAGGSGPRSCGPPRLRRGRPGRCGSACTPRPTPGTSTPAPDSPSGDCRSRRRASLTCTWRSDLPEIRVDPLTGLKVIVAADRADRPGGGFHAEPAPPVDPETDPFAEGHENRTPPEVY